MQSVHRQIARTAELTPNAEAIVCPDRIVSYQQLQQMIELARQELRTLAVNRLAIMRENSVDWVVIDLAAAAEGIVTVPIPLFFSHDQKRHLIQDSAIDTIYCDQPIDIHSGRHSTNHIASHHIASKIFDGKYLQLNNTDSSPLSSLQKVTYTSGSTGTPKGACITADAIDKVVSSLTHALSLEPEGRHLCLLPFSTLLENIAGIYLALANGRSVIVDRSEHFGLMSNHAFDVALFCQAVSQYRADAVILLPQMLKALVEHGDTSSLQSLSIIAVGGGKVSDDILRRAHEMGLPVCQGYGLTECASVVALNTLSAQRVGSVGKPLPHTRVRISYSGEIMISGSTMQGYLNHADAPSEIATGDAGFIDEDGYLFITGRIKNIIVSSFGRNISPEWIESHFLAQNTIQQIAVFGEARPYLSAIIYAGSDISDTALEKSILLANSALPDYAQVKQWYRTHSCFSCTDKTLTGNGKLRRDVIRQLYHTQIESLESVA